MTENVFTWNRAGAIGDVILSMNLYQNFKIKYPNSKVFYLAHPNIGAILHDLIRAVGFDGVLFDNKYAGKEIRLIGYPIPENKKNPGHHPYRPMEKHLIEYFADELEIKPDFNSFILSKPENPMPSLKYITLQTTAMWSPYKNWPIERWNEVAWNLVRVKIPVYQIGGPKDIKIPNASGRIMGPDPRQLFNTGLAAVANAVIHVGVDSWANHATNIQWRDAEGDLKRTHGVILWGSSQLSATGYSINSNIIKNLSCQPCFKEDPKVSKIPLKQCHRPAFQTYANPKHQCMHDITTKEVFEKIVEQWELATQ